MSGEEEWKGRVCPSLGVSNTLRNAERIVRVNASFRRECVLGEKERMTCPSPGVSSTLRNAGRVVKISVSCRT